jgi:hypothetical protein
MNRSIDIGALREVVERALRDKAPDIAGGWSTTGKGSVYTGATFRFGDQKWVAVRGPQRPGAAQLLDATACLQHREGATHAVALLDPEEAPRHEDASWDFRARYQAAVWDGLGIVALESAGNGAWAWKPADPHERGDVDDLAQRIEKQLEAIRPELTGIVESGDSKKAEEPVRRAVGLGLAGRFIESATKDREFDALWRHAIADGLWSRKGRQPETLALEVKVGEDLGAPFCQALDDLGRFDAVVYVRLLSDRTRAEASRLSGLEDVRREVEKRLPLCFIDVHFPAPSPG